MLRSLAILFGFGIIILGIMGFLPSFTTKEMLFDTFRVNLEHNIAHLSTGVLALLCGLSSTFASKMFFIIAGVIYCFLALFGFQAGEGMVFEIIAVNTAGNYLHAVIGGVCLLLGFGFKS